MPDALAKDSDLLCHTWTVDSLRDHLIGLFFAHDQRYQERHAALVELIRSNDLRYEQNFLASQRAVELASVTQQTSVSLALAAQKEAIATALVSAEKAVNAALVSSAQAVQKAENAAERRFEGVNEFRQTLSDQQRTLIPRAEVEVLIKSLTEKIAENQDAIRRQSEAANNMFARKEGQEKGVSVGWGFAVGIVGLILAVLSIVVMFRK